MCKYRITVTISNNSTCVDGGGWLVGMTWRKSVILDAEERMQAIALRDLLNSSKPAVDEGRIPHVESLLRHVQHAMLAVGTRMRAQHLH